MDVMRVNNRLLCQQPAISNVPDLWLDSTARNLSSCLLIMKNSEAFGPEPHLRTQLRIRYAVY